MNLTLTTTSDPQLRRRRVRLMLAHPHGNGYPSQQSAINKKFSSKNIIFSPEFLREGKALNDNLYPSRIVIGSNSNKAIEFANLLKDAAKKTEIKTCFMTSSEAEATKLFANTYLAMRVAFFNELDTFSEINNLSSKNIIDGVCSDSRIGNYYNNPSFGYGGYCLPKDTKQMLSSFAGIPSDLIKAIVDSNKTRKEYVANLISSKKVEVIGIFRLIMKKSSDNFRESPIIDIMRQLQFSNKKIIIYEPLIKKDNFENIQVVNRISDFKLKSDLIIANRVTDRKDIYYGENIIAKSIYAFNGAVLEVRN